MDEATEPVMLAKELPSCQFLRLAFLGSARSAKSGRKLTIDPRTGKTMAVIGSALPVLFLALLVSGVTKPSWPNAVAFLVIVVGIYVAAIRSAKLVEKET